MPARTINPDAEKNIEIGHTLDKDNKPIEKTGTSLVIIPLRRNQKKQISFLVPSPFEIKLEQLKDESDEDYDIRRYSAAFLHVDEDKAAEILAHSIKKINSKSVNYEEAVKYIQNLQDEKDYLKLYFDIMSWTGIDEETSNFSDSSLEQSTAGPAGENVEKPAEPDDDLASITPAKTEQ